jgi:acyl-CoA synthetase (NDP forming)
VPGKYDTLFIPEYKMRFPDSNPAPVAIISQSGAYLVAASSKLSGMNPRYLISAGNQSDLTVSDYLAYLKNDSGIKVFACYIEGFRPLDGLKWMKEAAEITRGGGTVLLYRAGRTAAGAAASASHTASIAGDYTVTCELARQAGAIVADTLSDFTDLIRLFCLLDGKEARGWNLAAISNAGFECVAMADRLGRFRPAEFSAYTHDCLRELLQREKLTNVVDVKNPLDVTPIMNDAGYGEAVRALLDDDRVNAAVVGCVPLTGRLNTLAAADSHAENVLASDSVASVLIRLFHQSTKPWIVVVDGGAPYDPMVALLERYGVPVFRSADRALALFETYCHHRMQP